MSPEQERRPVILVIENEEEIRYGIERLLTATGYRVDRAANEEEAVLSSSLHRPDLILMSPNLDAVQILPVARRIRERAGLDDEIPVVAFCVTGLDEGAETGVGFNVYITWPDNFNQLRALLSRLLRNAAPPG
jgi:DNA-binding response OmpR family regulator